MRIDDAAEGVGRAADAYERGRPAYPVPAVAWLAEALGVAPGTVVVDLGAGTGKLTRMLAAYGATLVAVEPVAAMRAKLAASMPGMRALEGTAESMPLPDGSADAVTVGQAFHWFDGERALAEIHRVLRPHGASCSTTIPTCGDGRRSGCRTAPRSTGPSAARNLRPAQGGAYRRSRRPYSTSCRAPSVISDGSAVCRDHQQPSRSSS